MPLPAQSDAQGRWASRKGPVIDAAMGGLNYQIEHHLFPTMPRPNLRRAQPLVAAYCAELALPYHQTGLLRSYADALRHLHAVGRPIRGAARVRRARARPRPATR